MLMSSILEVKRKELQDVPQNQLKSSLSLHWKSLRMESAEHMRRLLMMLLPNHSDRFFTKYISKDAKVVTDEWKGYLPLMDEYQIEPRKSENGKSFPQMHIHIMNIKGWLRGIHHHCTKERLQGYLDEYHFRFNRRNNMDTIFDVLMRRLMNNEPIRINSNN